MSWVRLDDGFAEHPKTASCTHRALIVHIFALCYCSRNLTDGEISATAAYRLIGRGGRAATRELVAAGMWVETPTGFKIHDYLDYQPSREDTLRSRERARERMRNVRRNNTGTFTRTFAERSPTPAPKPIERGPEELTPPPTPPTTRRHPPHSLAAAIFTPTNDQEENL